MVLSDRVLQIFNEAHIQARKQFMAKARAKRIADANAKQDPKPNRQRQKDQGYEDLGLNDQEVEALDESFAEAQKARAKAPLKKKPAEAKEKKTDKPKDFFSGQEKPDDVDKAKDGE